MPENCARVFSPAVAILESEKILGTRFANFSIGFILFLPIQPLDLYRIEEEFVVVVVVWIVTRDHSNELLWQYKLRMQFSSRKNSQNLVGSLSVTPKKFINHLRVY